MSPHGADQPRASVPLVMGHRGALYAAPENTLESFMTCAQMGADSVEFDIWTSKDGHLVVVHGETSPDGTRKGMLCGMMDVSQLEASPTSRHHFVEDLTWAELSGLRFQPNLKIKLPCPEAQVAVSTGIPLLRHVLEMCKKTGMRPTCELKGLDTAHATVELLEELQMTDVATISSFHHNLLVQTKQANPSIRTAALYEGVLQEDFIAQAKSVGADEVDLCWMHVLDQPQVVKQAHDAGLLVMAWFNGPRTMPVPETAELYARVANTGLDAMCVNHPALLVQVLKDMWPPAIQTATAHAADADLTHEFVSRHAVLAEV
uniref:GP-PDE domain-containing protein n=1 Tax=Eutreptiella gymnastica TaxID=73025 RepID=A0A7S1JDI3_9EUGL